MRGPAIVCGLIVSILILLMISSSIFTAKREARRYIKEKLQTEDVEVVFGAQRYRGIVCGKYRVHKVASRKDWVPFIFISLNSPEPVLETTLYDGDQVTKDLWRRFDCNNKVEVFP
jgi:hypothetical protein